MIKLYPRTSCLKLFIMLQKYNHSFLYTTSPYAKLPKCVAKQQYILLKQL